MAKMMDDYQNDRDAAHAVQRGAITEMERGSHLFRRVMKVVNGWQKECRGLLPRLRGNKSRSSSENLVKPPRVAWPSAHWRALVRKRAKTTCVLALHKKSCKASSLCNLCVLCVSVVDEFRAKTHHRDTENTEVAQRSLRTRTFSAKPFVAALLQKSETWLGYSQNHLAVAGGYVVDALDFVNVSEMPAAHPPATARWF